MSSITKSSQRSPSLELAERLLDHTPKDKQPLHEQILAALFEQIIKNLQEAEHRHFSPNLKQRIWEQVSIAPLACLKSILISAVAKEVLSFFREDEVKAMLDQHKKYGNIPYLPHGGKFAKIKKKKKYALANAVVHKVNSMSTDLVKASAATLSKLSKIRA